MSTAPDLRLVSADARLTWDEAVAKFLRLSTGLRANTLVAYRSDLTQFGEFLADLGITHPGDVRAPHVRAFIAAHMEWADTTKRRKCDSIARFYNDLLESEEPSVRRNPVTKGIRPKRTRRVRKAVPTAEETEALRSATRGPLERALFEAFVGMGLRRGEVLSLTVQPFARCEPEIVVLGKGGHERRVPTDAARGAVEAYLPTRPDPDSHALFLQERGKHKGQPVTEKVLLTMLRRWCRRAGLADRGLTLHSLRHRFGTSLAERGVDMPTIRDLMGHDSVETTDIYVHSNADRMRSAVRCLVGQGVTGHAPAQIGEGQAEVERGCGRVTVPEDALDGVQVTPAPQQQRGAGVPQGMRGRSWSVDAGAGQRPS
jgi:integrase/recombinase XerD